MFISLRHKIGKSVTATGFEAKQNTTDTRIRLEIPQPGELNISLSHLTEIEKGNVDFVLDGAMTVAVLGPDFVVLRPAEEDFAGATITIKTPVCEVFAEITPGKTGSTKFVLSGNR